MTPDPKPLSDTEIEQMFREWWAQSWPTPPGTHALRTHIAWATHLLDKINESTMRPESAILEKEANKLMAQAKLAKDRYFSELAKAGELAGAVYLQGSANA